MDNSTLKD